MESEISTLFTTLITKVDTTLENLLVEQERNNEVIKKLITDNNEKSKRIQELEDHGKEIEVLGKDPKISVPSDNPNNSRKP